MSATILVDDFLAGVSATLQDNLPQFRRWPKAELIRYANWGQLAIAKYVPLCGARVDAVRLKPGPVQDFTKVVAAYIKPGSGATPADAHGLALTGMVCNMGSTGATPGRTIRAPVDAHTLDAGAPTWMAAEAGTEVREWVFDKGQPLTAYVNPPVHATTPVWVLLKWNVMPARLAANPAADAVLGVGDQWADDLHNYVVAAALTKNSKNTQNLEKAAVHGAAFTSSINAQAMAVTGVNPNLKTLPFAAQIQAGQ